MIGNQFSQQTVEYIPVELHKDESNWVFKSPKYATNFTANGFHIAMPML